MQFVTSKIALYSSFFCKNCQLLYKKFANLVPSSFVFTKESFDAISTSIINSSLFNMKVTPILVFLAIYEVEISKTHIEFSKKDWVSFFSFLPELSTIEMKYVKENIFKKNLKHYPWTLEEDNLLKDIIKKMAKQIIIPHISWKKVAHDFNSSECFTQIRTPSNCQERWKNKLRTNYQKKDWTFEEDLLILEFAKNRGSKWSKIALILESRTEHCIKNRFFGILSKFLSLPQKRMKKELNYLDENFLNPIISKYKASIIEQESKEIKKIGYQLGDIESNYSEITEFEKNSINLFEDRSDKDWSLEEKKLFKELDFD